MMFCACKCLCTVHPGENCMLQPYTDSANLLEKIAKISGFCQSADMDFQCLAATRIVSVDLK